MPTSIEIWRRDSPVTLSSCLGLGYVKQFGICLLPRLTEHLVELDRDQVEELEGELGMSISKLYEAEIYRFELLNRWTYEIQKIES